MKGKRLEINTIISLDVHLANEMIAAEKFVKGKHKFAIPVPINVDDSAKTLQEIKDEKIKLAENKK